MEGIVILILAIPECFNSVVCVCLRVITSSRRRRSCPGLDNYMVGIVYYAIAKRDDKHELSVIMTNFWYVMPRFLHFP